MVDMDTIYVGFGVAAALGSLALMRNSVARQSRRIFGEEPAREQERIESIIANTKSLGTLRRIYQNGHGYLDQEGRRVETTSVGSEVIEIDPVLSLRAPAYLEDKLRSAEELGKKIQAGYFSLSEPNHVNRFTLYGISFHKENFEKEDK